VRTSCVWPEGGVCSRGTIGQLGRESGGGGVEVRLLQDLPFQLHTHTLDLADGSLGEISPLLLLVIMSSVSMGGPGMA
jgi:hypothetical protein